MEWFSKNKQWLIGTGFFILPAILRFLAADQTVHPTGWDGYYYVMQVHSWIEFGHMQAPDSSLIYPFFALITFIMGDPVLGFKAGVAIIAGLLTVSVYYYLLSRNVASTTVCIACSYLVFSPLVTYFVLQFPKNALGLVFFVFFMASLKRPGIATAILFLCTVLTHRMTGAFALLTVPLFVPWRWLAVGGIVVIALGFLPGIIHFSDIMRFKGQFTAMPHWAPFAFTKIYPTSLDWMFKTDLILLTAAAIAVIFMVRKKPSQELWVWLAVSVVSLFPFFSFIPGDVGHRFFMIAPVALMVLISLTLQRSNFVIVALFLVLSIFSFRSYKPWYFDAPNIVYVQVIEKLVNRYDPEKYPLVIAHKGLAEIIIFKTGFDALNWLSPEDMPVDQVLRISHNVTYRDFSRYLDKDQLGQVKSIAPKYYALPESTWQEFIEKAKAENNPVVNRHIYSGYNPMDERPYFIRKGKTQ
jgi:hypothetical protein